MREASVVAGIGGAQLPDIDEPRAQAVRPYREDKNPSDINYDQDRREAA
jgi:hypothetical protein